MLGRIMAPGRRLRWLLLVAMTAGTAWPGPSAAQETSGASATAARRHFDNARAHFGQGEYKEALTELEAAHSLDPTAKDLVFNLGVVHDKLSHVDDALRWFRLYLTMDPTDKERDRAEAYVHRLEASKAEPDAKHPDGTASDTHAAVSAPPAAPAPPSRAATSAPPPRPPSPTDGDGARTAPAPIALAPTRDAGGTSSWLTSGRIDTATLVAAGIAAGALAFGVTLGVKAKADPPGADFVTGRDGSYADLESRADSAHREAVLADIGFATAVVGTAVAAYLYFGRPRVVAAPPPRRAAMLGAMARPGGGVLSLRGSF